jgi:hypothetical protein
MLRDVTAADDTAGDADADPLGRVRRALEQGDAARALAFVDALPEHERPQWLVEVWMLAGAPRAVSALLPQLAEPQLARARAFVADPPRPLLPVSDAPDPYADLSARADALAARGRASELALSHLALSRVSPRVDWRVGHLEHAAALALSLGDPRLSALVRACEAECELDLGEHDDARHAASDALVQAEAADEPYAAALAREVLRALAARSMP